MDKQSLIINRIKFFQQPFELYVWGDSMAPTIKSGDKIKVIPYGKKILKIGDIIVYRKFNDHLTVHRIKDIIILNPTRFYCETKGDNNFEVDGYKVFNSEIIGVVDL